MHIQEFFATLENHNNNDASFLGNLRAMATHLVDQASQSFSETSTDGTFEFWSWSPAGGAACQASA